MKEVKISSFVSGLSVANMMPSALPRSVMELPLWLSMPISRMLSGFSRVNVGCGVRSGVGSAWTLCPAFSITGAS